MAPGTQGGPRHHLIGPGQRSRLSAAPPLEQAAAERPRRQFVAVRKLQLSQHVRHVRLYGLHREEQLLGDFFIRIPAGDHPHHFLLPAREPIQFVVLDCGFTAAGTERVEHESREPRREYRVATVDSGDGARDFRAGGGFREIPSRARSDNTHDVVCRVRNAQREHLGASALRTLGDDAGDLGSPAARPPGQVDVEENDIGLSLGDELDRLINSSRLPHDPELPTEGGSQPGPEDLVIIDDDDADLSLTRVLVHVSSPSLVRAPLPFALASWSTLTCSRRTETPLPPGPPTTFAVPPARSILPRIDSRTPNRDPSIPARSKPGPRSLTSMRMSSGVVSR